MNPEQSNAAEQPTPLEQAAQEQAKPKRTRRKKEPEPDVIDQAIADRKAVEAQQGAAEQPEANSVILAMKMTTEQAKNLEEAFNNRELADIGMTDMKIISNPEEHLNEAEQSQNGQGQKKLRSTIVTPLQEASKRDASEGEVARHGPAAGEAAEPYKPKWVDRFPEWVDDQAGVKLRQDRKNGLATIAFRDEPPKAAVALLERHGYEPDEGVYAKRVSKLRPAESREEAQKLAFEAANLVRQEMGLPQKDSFFVSRG